MDVNTTYETRSDEADGGLDTAVAAVGELRSAVEERHTALDTRLDALDIRLDALDIRSQRPAPGSKTRDEGDSVETRAFGKFLRFGREALAADETRALQVSGATAGETLVPIDFQRELIKNLVQYSPMRQIARVSQTTGSVVHLPRRTAALSAAWVAEGSANTPSQPAYGQHVIEVFEGRVHSDISNALLEDSAFAMASELAMDFAEEFGRLEGLAFVSGNGTSQPEGFLTSSDFTTVEAGGAAIDADDLIDLYHSVPSVFASRGTWVMNRATMGAVRKLKATGTGVYLWADSLAPGNPPTILGRPVVEMPDMADIAPEAVPLAFGDWNTGYRIFDRIGLSVLRDPFSRGANSEVRFLARKRVGGKLVNGQAVKGLAMPEA